MRALVSTGLRMDALGLKAACYKVLVCSQRVKYRLRVFNVFDFE
jgi:hypothetical protein